MRCIAWAVGLTLRSLGRRQPSRQSVVNDYVALMALMIRTSVSNTTMSAADTDDVSRKKIQRRGGPTSR